MRQDELHPSSGSKKNRKRIGRGVGSGHGTYACRGLKGQKSRSGGGVGLWFEGGQTPLVKRFPHTRGFTNIFKIEYSLVNVDKLDIFGDGSEVTPEKMYDASLISTLKKPIKILGDGHIQRSLNIKANKFSQVARQKIEAAGGSVEEI